MTNPIEQLNKLGVTEEQFRAVVQAAMPHLRTQIAEEIRAEMPPLTSQRAGQTMRACMEHSARIAEGETK